MELIVITFMILTVLSATLCSFYIHKIVISDGQFENKSSIANHADNVIDIKEFSKNREAQLILKEIVELEDMIIKQPLNADNGVRKMIIMQEARNSINR